MSRVCEICGKQYHRGHLISHSAHKTLHRSQPNLRTVRLEINGGTKKMRLCAKCLKQTKLTTS